MLQRIGDALKGQKWLSYIVLGALAVVFAAWGAYGIVNLNFGASSYAAEANGAKIPLEQARNAWLREQTQWQQRLGGSEIPAQLRAKLRALRETGGQVSDERRRAFGSGGADCRGDALARAHRPPSARSGELRSVDRSLSPRPERQISTVRPGFDCAQRLAPASA